MGDLANEICSLSDFKRNAANLIWNSVRRR